MLTVQVANAVSRMRKSDVQKPPGIAEAIDWVSALDMLGVETLDAESADRTLGSVLKYSEDQEVIRASGLENLIARGVQWPSDIRTRLDRPPITGWRRPRSVMGLRPTPSLRPAPRRRRPRARTRRTDHW